ncbi:hypothetical protein AB0D98_19070 [Streptomyces sp. NPDC047987]|uniref:helix-turn-helix transcriptional regulator n=1 Tax=unclassified Streptomyces TaxID=2593676 RepID=UPI003432C06C
MTLPSQSERHHGGPPVAASVDTADCGVEDLLIGIRGLLRRSDRAQLVDARTAPPVRVYVAKVVDRECCLALRLTRVAAPDSRTVLVVESIGVHALTAVAPLGVSAVLLHAEVTRVADVVATVAAGGHRLPANLRDQLFEVVGRVHPLGRPGDLMSPHEADVLRLVAQGGTAADVARAGYATERGALTMLSRLAPRLGVESRAGLVSYAYRHHLV